MDHFKAYGIRFLAALWLASSLGCGAREDFQRNATSHARALTMLYIKASLKLRRAPRDEQEFKQTLADLQVSPELFAVESLDELFTSERDGQPLGVVYDQRAGGSDVVVYEQTGADGKRLIGRKIGMTEEVDDAAFSALKLTRP